MVARRWWPGRSWRMTRHRSPAPSCCSTRARRAASDWARMRPTRKAATPSPTRRPWASTAGRCASRPSMRRARSGPRRASPTPTLVEVVNLTVPRTTLRFQVTGRVASPARAGVGGLRVQVVDKNAGPDVPLGGDHHRRGRQLSRQLRLPRPQTQPRPAGARARGGPTAGDLGRALQRVGCRDPADRPAGRRDGGAGVRIREPDRGPRGAVPG